MQRVSLNLEKNNTISYFSILSLTKYKVRSTKYSKSDFLKKKCIRADLKGRGTHARVGSGSDCVQV
jgi:hypothetical protein